jgi:hypothetical protein
MKHATLGSEIFLPVASDALSKIERHLSRTMKTNSKINPEVTSVLEREGIMTP